MGWQSLTAAPFTIPAQDPNYQYSQVIILLTDGLNTQDRWYTNASSIDARQQKTCANLKTAGITVYTVQVNTDNEATSTLLQNCASDSSKFFLLTSSVADRLDLRANRHRADQSAARHVANLAAAKTPDLRPTGCVFAARANQALTTPRKNYSAFAISQADAINQTSD